MEAQFTTTRSVQLWCSIYQGFLPDFLLFLISSRIKILSFMHKQQFNFPNDLWHEIGWPYQKILLFINQDYLKDQMQDFLAKVSEVLLTFSKVFCFWELLAHPLIFILFLGVFDATHSTLLTLYLIDNHWSSIFSIINTLTIKFRCIVAIAFSSIKVLRLDFFQQFSS